MTHEEILQKLKEILVSAEPENAPAIEHSNEQTQLAGELGLTSVGILYLVIVLEETFGIRFGDVGVSEFRTLGDVAAYIEEQQA